MLTPEQAQRAFNRPLPDPAIDVDDQTLINTMCSYGFDRSESFIQFKFSMPQQYRWLRGLALKFYADHINAQRGDAAAKERIEYCAEVWRRRLALRVEQGFRGDAFTADERKILRKMGIDPSRTTT